MARYIQPVMGPDYGKLILQGLGAFQQVKGIQRNQAQDAQTAEIKDLSARVNTDPEAMARLAVLDPTRAASLKRMQRLDAQDAEMANIKSLSGQAMTDQDSLAQLAALDPQKAAAIAQMQKQKRDEQIANEERFRKERAIMAGDMQGQDPATRVAILDKHIAKVVERGGDPSNSQGLRDLYASNDPEQIKKANVFVNNALQQGYREGYLKQPKVEKAVGTYRAATEDEKAAYGITDSAPYQISPQGRIVKVGGGQTINISTAPQQGQYKSGPIPAGWALTTKQGKPELVEIAGGPAAQEKVENIEKEVKKRETTARTANIVQEDIDRLTGLVENQKWYNPVTGITGGIFSNIPSTARVDAEALKTSIGANIGFDRLQRMREESKTGGALGAVSEREMRQLESVMGSINLDQSDEQLKRNLGRLNKIYTNILRKASAYPNAGEYGFGAKAVPVSQPAMTNPPPMPEEIRKRYY